jgi:hypothetical protein
MTAWIRLVPRPWSCDGCGADDPVALVTVELAAPLGKCRLCHTCLAAWQPAPHAEVCTNDPRRCPRRAEHPGQPATTRKLTHGGRP